MLFCKASARYHLRMTDNSSSIKPVIGLVGAGAMGGALLEGWLASGRVDASRSAVFDPNVTDEISAACEHAGVAINPDKDHPIDILIVAVKPQLSASVLPDFASSAARACVLSVMAGKSIAAVSRELGGAARVARAMPNLPAAIGKGASGLYAPPSINGETRVQLEALMASSGDVVLVDSEAAIDAVTAISGSGPAYFFAFVEALAEAGVTLGLSPENAKRLARATAVGAGAMLDQDNRSAADLRKAVTSPGGTTAAALSVLSGDDQALRDLVKKAATAAATRAGELTE